MTTATAGPRPVTISDNTKRVCELIRTGRLPKKTLGVLVDALQRKGADIGRQTQDLLSDGNGPAAAPAPTNPGDPIGGPPITPPPAPPAPRQFTARAERERQYEVWFRRYGTTDADKAAAFADEWLLLKSRGAIGMPQDRYVELNMAKLHTPNRDIR